MIQLAPRVFADNVFALPGGTAISLFVRDMPCLSDTRPLHMNGPLNNPNLLMVVRT